MAAAAVDYCGPAGNDRRAAFDAAFRVEAAYGWTGVHSMSVAWADVGLLDAAAKQAQRVDRGVDRTDRLRREREPVALASVGPRHGATAASVTRRAFRSCPTSSTPPMPGGVFVMGRSTSSPCPSIRA